MTHDKISAYVGFAIKKGSVLYGVDNVVEANKRTYIILTDEKLSGNSTDRVKRYAERKTIPLYNYSLQEILPNGNCLALGITDENLARAIETAIKER